MNPDLPTKRLEFVVKISKYCNLRCRYCYEYDSLHLKNRMSLADIRRMFENVVEHAVAGDYEVVQFIWHGGEPFLIKPDYYREIGALQREIFGGRIPLKNTIQTNLTVLTDDMIALVGDDGFLDGIGVSFDPYGTARVDTKGALRNTQIVANLQTLIDRRVPFGAITVLARDTLPHAVRTFAAFDTLRIQHRFLPYYMSADAEQIDAHALSYDEIRGAFADIFDAWLESENAIIVDPIEEYRIYAQRYLTDSCKSYFDYRGGEFVFIVDVDGGLWGVMGAYDPAARYGNLFAQPLGEIMRAPARVAQAEGIGRRVAAHCERCPYFGHCTGKYVVHATSEERKLLDSGHCVVRDSIDHILMRYRETGVDRELMSRGPAVEQPVLAHHG